MMKYILEIQTPGDAKVAAASFEASTPFGGIARGDLLSGSIWPSNPGGGWLRVTEVKHMLSEADGEIMHKICLETEKAPRAK